MVRQLADWKIFESKAFITLQPAAAVKDLAIWYPNQNPASISAYPPSILFGQFGYFGGSSCNATHITLVNSYYGISLSKNNREHPPLFTVFMVPRFRVVLILTISVMLVELMLSIFLPLIGLVLAC
jgi:hypothetical protein